MDYELVRSLTIRTLRNMLERFQQGQTRPSQFATDMQVSTITSNSTRHARELGHIGSTTHMTPQEQGFVTQTLWELIIQGILTPTNLDGGTGGWPSVSFTEYGKRAITAERPAPYDPTAFLAQFPDESTDSIVRFYVEEALGCFRANRYTAAVVMLGAASEKLFDLLLDAFSISLASEIQRENLARRTKDRSITVRYRELRQRLDPKIDQLPDRFHGNFDTNLTSIFNLIRQERNDSGHPTGRAITRDEASSLLNVYPHYHNEMVGLIECLSESPSTLT